MNRRRFIGVVGACVGWVVRGNRFELAEVEEKPQANGKAVPQKVRPSAKGRTIWEFGQWGDADGWTVPLSLTGAVMGGGLWLTITPIESNADMIEQPSFQIGGDRAFNPHYAPALIESPTGLNISASRAKKICMHILNLSPETDGYVYWRTAENPDQDAGPVRFTMEPNLRKWQEIVCHIDQRWVGIVDQIKLAFGITAVRGDIWIDRIEIADGVPQSQPLHPDVCSDCVVPKVTLPEISQESFRDAFKVLDECLITHIPVFGFKYAVMSPGGGYGENWWQLDSSLAVAGAKWVNQGFAENVMRGFKCVQEQNPDGRIDLYGGSAIRGQIGDNSSLPRLFEMAYDIARRTENEVLREDIYLTTKRYLDWWLGPVKRDPTTKLITGVFEETFSDTYKTPQKVDINPQTLAPTDLNVAVAQGCYYVSVLAGHLGQVDESIRYMSIFGELRQSINQYMWDSSEQAYYNYDVRLKKRRKKLICTTFDPLRLSIAPPDRVDSLIAKLLDPRLFNWGKVPVTTMSRAESDYVEERGTYNGAQWFGDVWALRNLQIIAGLEDVGRHDLAAELAWVTVKSFNGKYTEYLIPSTGEGDGVTRYAWSASLYIAAVIEHLFGVDYDAMRGRVRVLPRIPKELMGKDLYIRELILPTGNTRLSLMVNQTAIGEAQIATEFVGDLPEGNIEVILPMPERRLKHVVDETNHRVQSVTEIDGLRNTIGIIIPVRRSAKIRFV